MLQFQREADAYAKNFPPVQVAFPFEPHRVVNDILAMRTASGGPVMAEQTDRWIGARGRRIFCRVYRPRTDRPLPTLVYFHGGGWVWSSVDTHDRLAREYAAAGEVAVVSVDYAMPCRRRPNSRKPWKNAPRSRAGSLRKVVGGDWMHRVYWSAATPPGATWRWPPH